jgi:glutamate carboxypeptidase
MSNSPIEVLAWLEDHRSDMASLLERLALAESPSGVLRAGVEAASLLEAELQSLDYHVIRLSGAEAVHLYARPRFRVHGSAYQLVVGHLDTVWPIGTLRTMPVRQENGRLYGPGVYDMKGGLIQLLFALRALDAHDLRPTVTPVVVVNGDEEVGSDDSSRLIAMLARGATRALVLEPPAEPDGKLKTARKGAGRFTVTVRGLPAHAGTSPEEGVSAILELAHQVEHLFALNDPGRGVTVNVGTIDGGLRPNVVAPVAKAHVDVRAPDDDTWARVAAAIRGLRPVTEGASLIVEGGLARPPMAATRRNQALYGRARLLGEQLGLELNEAPRVGGTSDANTTSRYTATLDGLGSVGSGAHAADEHVLLSQLAPRAALLALLLLEPASRYKNESPSVPTSTPLWRANSSRNVRR